MPKTGVRQNTWVTIPRNRFIAKGPIGGLRLLGQDG